MAKVIKVITITICSFLLTACYDYREVNSIDIITGIGIDYQDDEYITTLEVLKNTGDKTAIKLDTEIISGKGSSLSNSLVNATNNLNKSPNYSHLKVMVLTKPALEAKWFSIMDFFLRNTDFRENFYVVITNDKPIEIFNTKDSTTKVTSILIANLFENQKYNTIDQKFEDYASDYLSFNKSLIFTNVDIINNKLTINGTTIFNNKLYDLSKDDLEIYNLFNNSNKKIVIDNYYDSNVFSVTITNSNLKTSIKDNTILISGSINAKILNNETNINIRNLKNIDMLNKDFKEIIENRINNLFKIIKNYNTDIFGIDNMNYQINRKKIKNYWLNQDIKKNIDFNIDKKGLIYEVDYEK